MEVTEASDKLTLDFDVGDTNDVEISCDRGLLDFGMYVICPGTEYGALLEETDTWTNSIEEIWRGNSFRKFLQQFIIQPPDGEDYLTVSGDAHAVMRQVLDGAFGGLFSIPSGLSGIDVGTYQFERYTDALSGFTKMLKRKNARIQIEIVQGEANEPFSVALSAVPIQNKSGEIEYSQDSKMAVNLKESHRGINHLICLGAGELKNRTVVHLYAQLDGSISQKQYYTGLHERMAVYDYSSVESIDELIRSGTEELETLMNTRQMNMSVQDVDMQIGDIIAGRNYKTGLYMQKPIVRKIVKMSDGKMEIEYRTEGEE